MAFKRTIVFVLLLGFVVIPSELIANADNDAVVLSVREMDTSVEVIAETLQEELPEEAFLHQPGSGDTADTTLKWVYELELPVETVKKRITVNPHKQRATSSYWFDVGDERTCRRVLNNILRRDGADTVAREKGLFDVCENVRSVGRDEVSLRWKNKELREELTIDIERDKRLIYLNYRMPFLGH